MVKYLDKVETAINHLEDFPMSGTVPKTRLQSSYSGKASHILQGK